MTEENKFIDLQRFQLTKKIGKGAFSEVFLVREKATNKEYAAKVVNIKISESTIDDEQSFFIYREIKLVSSLNHPAIIEFIGFSPINFDNMSYPTIIMEYLQNGTLTNLLELERKGLSPKFWDDTKKMIIIYGVASGLCYLHANHIIHRDMKPDNILLDEFLFPKIADFGLSKTTVSTSESMNIQSQSNIKGTPIYMSPEILMKMEYSPKCDVYAFALITYEILSGDQPFSNLNFTTLSYEVAVKGSRPKLTQNIPKKFCELLEMCWDQKPEYRPSMEYIVDTLKNDAGFLTDTVDQQQFYDYVDFVDNYQSSFELNRSLHFDDFKNQKGQTSSISRVKIVEIDETDNNSKNESNTNNALSKEKVLECIDKVQITGETKADKAEKKSKDPNDIENYKVNPWDYEVIQSDDESEDFEEEKEFEIKYAIQKSTNLKTVIKTTSSKLKKKTRIKFDSLVKRLAAIHHPAIIPFIGYSDHKNRGSLYFKLMANNSLEDLIQSGSNQQYDFTHKLIISYGIACAIEYLHSHDIVHQNIKSTNVLLDEELRPYLADLKIVTKGDLNLNMTVNQTAIIMAPEFFDNFEKYNGTKPLDIYSYGLLLFEIWSEKKPFDKIKTFCTMLNTITRGELPTFPYDKLIPEDIKELTYACTQLNFNERPEISEICDFFENQYLLLAESESSFDKQLFENYIKLMERKTE